MNVWGINKLKDPNSNHIITKVLKRRQQLSTRQQTATVLKELTDLDKKMIIGQMLLDKWYDTHLDNRLPNRFDNR
jgi:hypothetical protein